MKPSTLFIITVVGMALIGIFRASYLSTNQAAQAPGVVYVAGIRG